MRWVELPKGLSSEQPGRLEGALRAEAKSGRESFAFQSGLLFKKARAKRFVWL